LWILKREEKKQADLRQVLNNRKEDRQEERLGEGLGRQAKSKG